MEKGARQQGIYLVHSAPYSSAGKAEANIFAVENLATTMLTASGLPPNMWDYAVKQAARVLDMMPRRHLGGKSMYERREGEPAPYGQLWPLGCLVYIHEEKGKRGHGAARGRKATHLGKADDGPGYLCEDHLTGQLRVSNSVTMVPHRYPALEKKRGRRDSTRDDGGVVREETGGEALSEAEGKEETEPVEPGGEAAEAEDGREKGEGGVRRSSRNRQKTAPAWGEAEIRAQEMADKKAGWTRTGSKQQQSREDLVLTTCTDGRWWQEQAESGQKDLPKNLQDVEKLGGVERSFYMAAVEQELQQHSDFGTMERMGRMDEAEGTEMQRARQAAGGLPVIGSRFTFEKKLLDASKPLPEGPTYRADAQGRKWRYKARLVGKGFQQKEADYGDTYSATPRWSSLLLMIALCLRLGWVVHQLDVKAAFLIPELSDEERMALVLPKGCPGGEYLWKLLKSIYGLKQSGARWAAEAGRMLRAEGFEQTRADVCVWVKKDEKGKLQCALLVHVDDFAVGASGTMIEECKAGVKRTYTVSDDGEMSWFLKVRVDWSADRQSVTLSQFDYTKDLLEKTGMWGANPRHVPATPKSFLGGEKEPFA